MFVLDKKRNKYWNGNEYGDDFYDNYEEDKGKISCQNVESNNNVNKNPLSSNEKCHVIC